MTTDHDIDEMDDLLAKLAEQLREKTSLEGKNIVVTGKLYNFTRPQIISAIELKGGSSPGAVSKHTVALVAGERPGSVKVKAAIQRNLPILTEDQIMAMLEASDL